MYRAAIKTMDKFVPTRIQPFWNHPAGPKTIFFWAPIFKWNLVIAGIADINRPAEKLSFTQSAALLATGTIWSRYSMIIIPKNYALFAVNMFTAFTGIFQVQKMMKKLKKNEYIRGLGFFLLTTKE